jgi:addiction module RelE/StbE family toxin
VRTILWTEQARSDLAAIHAFITQDSPKYAAVVVRQLITAIDQIAAFPDSGRAVPEFEDPQVREIVRRPYRIVYRTVGPAQIHVLTVHHGSRRFPSAL